MRQFLLGAVALLLMTGSAGACSNYAQPPQFFQSPPAPPVCEYDNNGVRRCESWQISSYRTSVESYMDALESYAEEAARYAEEVHRYANCAIQAAADDYNIFVSY